MKKGTRVYLDLPPMPINANGQVDANNGRSGTVTRTSPDGRWVILVLDGDHHTNERWVHPDSVVRLDQETAA